MGRPRVYDERSASDLLAAAERIVEAEGLGALSVRRVASDIGVTTRAVYSLFGSKDALVVALGARAFRVLLDGLEALPATSDPAADLVEAGTVIFRRFALEHPALLRIGFQNEGTSPELAYQFGDASDQALAALQDRFARLAEVGRLETRCIPQAICAFDALCQGLAALELRGHMLPANAEAMWRYALSALVAGWRAA
jgi:AcrR family transcriptional regulator